MEYSTEKYEVSDKKSESLTDVTMEWNQYNLEGTDVDPRTVGFHSCSVSTRNLRKSMFCTKEIVSA